MRRKNPYPGVSRVSDRHGKRRWRFRRKGIDCYLHGDYGSTEFVAGYEKALQGVRPDGKAKADRLKQGTFEWLIYSYRQSSSFKNLAAISKKNLNGELNWLREQIGDLPFARFEIKHVSALMAKKSDRPTAANKIKKLLSRLFNHAMRLELVSKNPARLAQRYKENADGFHTWTDTELLNSESATRAVLRRA